MADIKFACPQCGQHIACDALWSGHQIQCPACQSNLTVPHLQPPPAAAAPALNPQAPQPPAPGRSKLSAGPVQATRPTPPGAAPRRPPPARPPSSDGALLKYSLIALVVAVIAGAGYLYVPSLLKHGDDTGDTKAPASSTTPSGGGGPLGEVNGAMDISDTLDGGGAPSRPRPAAARPPAAAQPPVVSRPPARPAAASAAPATNAPVRGAHRRLPQ